VLELRGERFRIGGRLAVAGQTLHEVGGQFPGDALHLVELAVEEFRHETADEVLDFLVGEGGVAPFLVGGHDPGVDLARRRGASWRLGVPAAGVLLVDPVGRPPPPPPS